MIEIEECVFVAKLLAGASIVDSDNMAMTETHQEDDNG